MQSGGQQGDKGVTLRSIPPFQVCPGQQFLTSSMAAYTDDVLLEHYLYSWDELIKYGVCVSVCVRVFIRGTPFKLVMNDTVRS